MRSPGARPATLRPPGDSAPLYRRLVATGGIGHGILLTLEGDATLGRNESRTARLEDARDYCKLHIVGHYVSVLMGAGRAGAFEVVPVGRTGDDEAGRRLATEMAAVGMTMDGVSALPGTVTLFSVCFLYPDGSGGNITTAESASGRLAPADIDRVLQRYAPGEMPELVLAAPEVPLETRVHLLKSGRLRGSRTIASVLPGEARRFGELGGFEATDLLAINMEESRAIAGIADPSLPGPQVVSACRAAVESANPSIELAVTDGRSGSYGCSGGRVEHCAGIPVAAVSTAGAGDAFLAGVLCGLCCGLPFLRSPGAPADVMSSAMDLGNLVAAMSVTSRHSIHPGISAGALLEFAASQRIRLAGRFRELFPGGEHDA